MMLGEDMKGFRMSWEGCEYDENILYMYIKFLNIK